MPFSHHSHSGQFCNHANCTLASMLQTAYYSNFLVYSLTEHMPRSDSHMYPEEFVSGYDNIRQTALFDAFLIEAHRLRDAYATLKDGDGLPGPLAIRGKDDRLGFAEEAVQTSQRTTKTPLEILIGFESEWIEPASSIALHASLLSRSGHLLDFCIGSVHFVREIPIDYSRELYEKARDVCGGMEVNIFEAYFDHQFDMLRALKPKIVGHFDLIRLYSDNPDASWDRDGMESVWEKILRNLRVVRDRGGLLEINTAALRKGLAQPYPRVEICRAWKDMGGDVVLSDDAHGIGHVGTNYDKLPMFLESWGCERVAYLFRKDGKVVIKTMEMEKLEGMGCWAGDQVRSSSPSNGDTIGDVVEARLT